MANDTTMQRPAPLAEELRYSPNIFQALFNNDVQPSRHVECGLHLVNQGRPGQRVAVQGLAKL